MNNLVVLYELENREEERNHWLGQVERYRQRNPYFHAWLGDEAGDQGDWQGALTHYKKAVRLLPEDPHLLYARGLIHYELGQLEQASRYLERAVEKATLRSDREVYQNRLEAVRREVLAGI
jgi:tetratricopeptide (TPR) repeat protein